ncbi:hypothetical protein AB0E12_33105 [Micromonospora chersina]|uniref:hypothetical protein n=1 Tax=Micromonospora chersina TaxID=47854 RepID=UPI0033F6A42B
MTKYFRLDPEVPGELGPNTVMDRSVHPPRVSHLHFLFTDWLGDCLVQSFPCFLISEDALDALLQLSLTGFSSDLAELGEGDGFRHFNPDASVPRFLWLKVSGVPCRDDFGLSSDGDLVISDRVLWVLEEKGLSMCEVTAL